MSTNLHETIIDPIFGKPSHLYAELESSNYYIEPETMTIFQRENPTVADMENYLSEQYSRGFYKKYSELRPLKIETGNRRLKRLLKYGMNVRSCADIGCATGAFMECAQNFGFEVKGFELSQIAINLAPDSIRNKIIKADINSYLVSTSEKFDLVTAYDILEHVQDPKSFLQELKMLLNPGGIIAISTPDTEHFLRRLLGKAWPMLQPMQHTFLFGRSGLTRLMQEVGFIDVRAEAAEKVLTLEYLFDQVAEPSPVLGGALQKFGKVLPNIIKSHPVCLNLSEMFVMARKPD